ncbi:glutamate receptor 1.2-like isoform X1 [Cynara cardunculus var. scolymus]|uniref:glutamate receptor 1.2-like isoform X1 n=1 Tax=Cynara cardunculus var. scolymus TaxID=59895 RepID=UPI000D628886|nr:glutamate receptor 1.2-like isoform X1 [Cynara cardunculus var. scolymus]XP_024980758.1 glutamate receptor 1.2-like isoform X1 [Cynara cardunculus var. scolymus]
MPIMNDCMLYLLIYSKAQEYPSYKEIPVGVILDMGSWVRKTIYGCITMALSDFYTVNSHYQTRIVLHDRDTHGEPLQALSAALDLLENTRVQAIVGPESSVEARFLEVLGEKANVPILSLATSPYSNQNPYLLQIAQDETNQFEGIAAMVESFKWKTVILICEDTANGREMATYMVTAFQEKSIHVTYTSLISTSASNDYILNELHKLLTMQTTLFVMHTSPSLASNLFSMAKEVGMMGEGYMWIVTSKTTNFLDSLDVEAIESMQGAVGFKSYFPESRELHDFVLKWRKEHFALNPFMEFKEVDPNGIWAYDAICALAMAVERVQTTIPRLDEHVTELASKDLTTINGTSRMGAALLNEMLRVKFNGVGGEFKLMNGRIVSKAIEVINVIGKGDRRVGFWIASGEFTKKIGKFNLSSNSGLEMIIWPGGTLTIPKRRRLQMNGKKLRILIPDFGGFPNLVHVTVDPGTNLPTASGFCGDVFKFAFNALGYGVDIEFTRFSYEDGGTYNDLINKIHLKEFDAAIGDITITANRSRYVDFTIPISDLGIGTLARNANKSMWIFFDPLSADLWITSCSFLLFLAFLIWFIEHRSNEEFQGSTRQQIGTTLWFACSTLVYAHRQNLQSNLSRFVVTVWVFVVLVLISSYTATLTSHLTVQQIALKEGSIGFQSFSPIARGAVFNNLKFADFRMEKLNSSGDYVKALTTGGFAAIIDEILYIKSVLALYSAADFSLVATSSTTNGFGFAFKKGSPLAQEMSTEIAKLREDGTLKALEDKWLYGQSSLMTNGFSSSSPHILNLHGFRGLFLISGVSMVLALLVSIVYRVHEKWRGKSKMQILRCILRISTSIHVQDSEAN